MYNTPEAGSNTVWIIILVIFLVELILWGFATAILAQKRGRNAGGWFFLGAFGLWFALIVLLLLPPIGGDYKMCSSCAEVIGLRAQVCPHCGYSFVSQWQQQPAPPQ